jgi:hypothetical protein
MRRFRPRPSIGRVKWRRLTLGTIVTRVNALTIVYSRRRLLRGHHRGGIRRLRQQS